MSDKPDFEVRIDRNPAPRSRKGGAETTFLGAEAQRDATASTLAQKRKQRHAEFEQAEATRAAGEASLSAQMASEPADPADAAGADDDLETIEFTAPNGRHIVYGPRNDVSLTARIVNLARGRDLSNAEWRLWRTLLGVRSVDGIKQAVVDEITRDKLANLIGDVGIDLLAAYDAKYFPPLRKGVLPTVKKNHRGP